METRAEIVGHKRRWTERESEARGIRINELREPWSDFSLHLQGVKRQRGQREALEPTATRRVA